MKTHTLFRLCLLLGAVSLAGKAQTMTPQTVTPGQFGPHSGSREFTLGASGAADKHVENSVGGLSFSLGSYFNDTLEGLIRQSVDYSNPKHGGSSWNGSTRLALDEHFGTAPIRPFVGINFGGIYGDNVRDTMDAGLEAGAKFYVQPRTFIYLTAEYAWSFRHADAINDQFDQGQFNWSAGIGFNF